MESEMKIETLAKNIGQLDQRIQNHKYLTLEQKEKDMDQRAQLWNDFCREMDASARRIIIKPEYPKNKLY